MARLRITADDGSEQIVALPARKVQIGRARDNDVVLQGAEKGVSRIHAELRFENGRHVIVDLQSQNGTWVNGRRVERAEVPYGAEIAVGQYRLMLMDDLPATREAPITREPSSARRTQIDPLDDFRAEHSEAPTAPAPAFPAPPPPPAPAAPAAGSGVPRWVFGASLAVVATIGVAAVAWVSNGRSAQTAQPPAANSPGDQAAQAPSGGAPSPSGDAGRPADPPAPTSDVSTTPAPVKTSVKSGSEVRRKPDETTEAWRSRSAALRTRYDYSKAAMDRGDFAAAAGGFEAILLEEPGYLDVPQLLVQAQTGLRTTARNLFEAGQRLEATGDWVGARQKYEQAKQTHAGVPGLAEGLQRVRQKLRDAGTKAFAQAKQLEAMGRVDEALKEYEKAVQWLSPDDPNRQTARIRIEQLKRQ